MKAENLRFVAAALLAVLLVSAVTQAFPAVSASVEGDAVKAEAMIKIASKAGERVIELNETVQANGEIMDAIENAGLLDAFHGNVSLIEDGLDLLDEANESFNSGDYTDAINKAMEAMEVFKGIWVNIHKILCAAGVTEAEGKPEVQAQGLLVAIERALERIERIENMSDDQEFKDLLRSATDLLDLDEVQALLEEGNISDVAHRLAEANNLIALAHKKLKANAEAKMAERMERFRTRMMERLEAMAGKLNETDLEEIMSEMDFRNMGEFRQTLNNLMEEAEEHARAGRMGYALGKLRNLSEKFKGFARRFNARTVPSEAREESPALEVSVEKRVYKSHVVIGVTVRNTGNCDVVFPNAALGLIIEKKVDGEWVPHYRPASAQVLTVLEQDESKEIIIRIARPDEGTYRATVNGWSKITLKPATASAEFNIP